MREDMKFLLWGAGCYNCSAQVYGFDTEQEAIAAWNRRAERTCEVVRHEVDWPLPDGSTTRKVLFNCSECGEWIGKTNNYCPNCGAKVVE